ncbi:hypothetical protein K439DRAFT_1368247, partial [Ramaria rubella]
VLDHQEGLVVACLFELSKAHHSGTGYMLCKHIGKALKACSEAIHTAVKNYNGVAAMLKPPQPPLEIQTVLEYVYIAQFDLLRESHSELPNLPWAQPAEREVATAYFKLQRSHKEIVCVNVEVCWLVTWMDDEEMLLMQHIQRLEDRHPELAFHIQWRLEYLVTVNRIHCQKITLLWGL